ncbi:M3 family peptidase, partial [Myxococcota bacterium]|nr:M3 family peptidase [Myxococcota bacterium]
MQIPWSSLTSDRVLEAVQEGVRLGEQALAKIAALPPEARGVDSVLMAFERATEPLDFAWNLINHLDSVDNSPALRDAIRESLPLVSGF